MKKDDIFLHSGNASWLEISASALRRNIESFRNIAKDRFLIGTVLKGNAYGHGLEEVFPIVGPLVDCIYVICAQDAFKIRSLSRTYETSPRILVMGSLSCEEVIECAKQNIEMVVADPAWESYIERLRKEKVKVKAHIHIDSGLSREGFSFKNIKNELQFLVAALDVFQIQGAMSHFANTEDVTEQRYAKGQLEAFHEGVDQLKAQFSLENSLEQHFAASAATLVLPEARLSISRVGISLYGFWPSRDTRISTQQVLKTLPKLYPVLSWKCKSQMTKWLKSGDYVGYGCTYRCNQDTRIAVLPIGYYDGYPRLASGKAHVLVGGKRCPVLGRVMMNHIIVDITHSASNQDCVEAILIGREGDEEVSAEMLAGWAETIHYEIVTRLGSHLKRIVVE